MVPLLMGSSLLKAALLQKDARGAKLARSSPCLSAPTAIKKAATAL
jgi:hypothetical protein